MGENSNRETMMGTEANPPNCACSGDPSRLEGEYGQRKTQNSKLKTPRFAGVGIDIVEVARIEAAVKRHGSRFLDRLFTRQEIDYAATKRRQAETLAGRFAAKEAFIKACGMRPAWREIEVRQHRGRPFIVFDGEEHAEVSISHERSYAVSVVVLGNERLNLTTSYTPPNIEEAP